MDRAASWELVGRIISPNGAMGGRFVAKISFITKLLLVAAVKESPHTKNNNKNHLWEIPPYMC